MNSLLKNTKDFKIIPENFKSSGEFVVTSIGQDDFTAKLKLFDEKELDDYIVGCNVEVFGVNEVGLIYFETKILKKDALTLTLAMTQDYSVIQRREYSRVKLKQGQIIIKDMADNLIEDVEDISASGVKFTCSQTLTIDKEYDIEVVLSNNMKIECKLQPVRIIEKNGKYIVSERTVVFRV